jgi:hypothetical protein
MGTFKLMSGYPPKDLISRGEGSLGEAGVRNGDAITVAAELAGGTGGANASRVGGPVVPGRNPATSWCVPSAVVHYTRDDIDVEITAVHPPMPDDTDTFVTIKFPDGQFFCSSANGTHAASFPTRVSIVTIRLMFEVFEVV